MIQLKGKRDVISGRVTGCIHLPTQQSSGGLFTYNLQVYKTTYRHSQVVTTATLFATRKRLRTTIRVGTGSINSEELHSGILAAENRGCFLMS